jgi:hypothetical protein
MIHGVAVATKGSSKSKYRLAYLLGKSILWSTSRPLSGALDYCIFA